MSANLQDLIAFARTADDAVLIQSLAVIDAVQADEAQRLAGAAIIEVLAERHPAVAVALRTWGDDFSTDATAIEAVLAVVA